MSARSRFISVENHPRRGSIGGKTLAVIFDIWNAKSKRSRSNMMMRSCVCGTENVNALIVPVGRYPEGGRGESGAYVT